MADDRLAETLRVCQEALARDGPERSTYLEAACGSDSGLRRDVEALLAQRTHRQSFLETPAWCAPAVAVGERLGPYEVTGTLGAGGMGAVYRARDTRLGRTVALKVIAGAGTLDPLARDRFTCEARAIAALNHPHICALHDVGREGDVDFLVMECLEGETLADRLKAGPLPVDKALQIGAEIAAALSAAHGKGIVHRDLKPANVFLTSDGPVKLLDFGVAKLADPPGPAGKTSRPTTALVTGASGRLGTVGYMAPEQVRGLGVDERADLFALGCVLYEMLSGRQAFAGDTDADTLSAILTADPPRMGAPGTRVPPEIEAVVTRCLRKHPDDRFQSAKDVAGALAAVGAGLKAGGASRISGGPSSRGLLRGRWRWIAGAAALVAAALAGMLVIDGLRGSAVRAVAVLPLANGSGDPGQDATADALTEALIADLGKVRSVRVIAHSSVAQFRGAAKPLKEIADALGGLDAIVEGSVRRAGDTTRIQARLINVGANTEVWNRTFERPNRDMLSLQGDMVRAVADGIDAALTGAEQSRLANRRQVDARVYADTTTGKTVIEYATREEPIRQAADLFQAAIDRDPTYAPAWAGLSESLWSLATTGFEYVPSGDVREKAVAAAERSLALDESLPEAHKARALIAWDGEWDIAAAQRHFERALELRPGYAAAHTLYALMLAGMPLQRFDEARRHMDDARRLDPLSPWNDVGVVAWWLYQGQPARAFDEGGRARQRNPTPWMISWQRGFAQLLLERPDRAWPEFEASLAKLEPDRPASVLAPLCLAYGLAGRRADAQRLVAEMDEASHSHYVSPYYLATAYSGVGRMDEAFQLLDRALEDRVPMLVSCTPRQAMDVALQRDLRWKPFIARLRRLVRLPPGEPDPYS